MPQVKLTVTSSECRCGYHKMGEEFIVGDLCPPLCHELWHTIYPSVYALLNGAVLDYGAQRTPCFDAKCPDGGRVCVHGEAVEAKDPYSVSLPPAGGGARRWRASTADRAEGETGGAAGGGDR